MFYIWETTGMRLKAVSPLIILSQEKWVKYLRLEWNFDKRTSNKHFSISSKSDKYTSIRTRSSIYIHPHINSWMQEKTLNVIILFSILQILQNWIRIIWNNNKPTAFLFAQRNNFSTGKYNCTHLTVLKA